MDTEETKKNVEFFSDRLLAALTQSSALAVALEAQEKSADVGFDFKDIGIVMSKVHEEFQEVQAAFETREKDLAHFHEEIGDCFFVLVNLCRHAKVDPEKLLQANVQKYLLRCKYIEDLLMQSGRKWTDMSLEEIYATWKEAKKSGL